MSDQLTPSENAILDALEHVYFLLTDDRRPTLDRECTHCAAAQAWLDRAAKRRTEGRQG